MSTVIITGSATLRVLNVSNNDIGDDGMAVISEALQHNKSLTTLMVAMFGLSVKGTVVCVFICILQCDRIKYLTTCIYIIKIL